MNPTNLARLLSGLPYVSSVEEAGGHCFRLRLVSFGWVANPIELIVESFEHGLLLTSLPLPTLAGTAALGLAAEINNKLTLGKVVLREDGSSSTLLYVARPLVRRTTTLPRLLLFLLQEAVCAVSLAQRLSEK